MVICFDFFLCGSNLDSFIPDRVSAWKTDQMEHIMVFSRVMQPMAPDFVEPIIAEASNRLIRVRLWQMHGTKDTDWLLCLFAFEKKLGTCRWLAFSGFRLHGARIPYLVELVSLLKRQLTFVSSRKVAYVNVHVYVTR